MAGKAQKNIMGIIESSIGGSAICEAVKQIANVLFESQFDDYDDDFNTENDDDEDFSGKLYGSEQDDINRRFGVPMSIVGEEHVRSLDPVERKREDARDQYEREMEEQDAEVRASESKDIDIAYKDAKNSIRKLATNYSNKRVAIQTCKEIIGQFVIEYLKDCLDNEPGEQKLMSQYNLTPAKIQKLKRWLDQVNENPSDEFVSVGSLYTYNTQPIILSTKSLDMAGDFMRRNPTGSVYAMRVELPYIIVNGQSYDVPWSSAIEETRSLTWYNHLLSQLPISQKKGGSVTVHPNVMDVGNAYECITSLVKIFFKHFDEIYVGSSPMEGNGLDDDNDIDPVDSLHTQMSTDNDDIGDNTEETEENYYNAYKGDAAADAFLARNAANEEDEQLDQLLRKKEPVRVPTKAWNKY